ncbi:MAG: pilin [Patescibacteria group bacterium]
MKRVLIIVFLLLACFTALPAQAVLVSCENQPAGLRVGDIERDWIRVGVPIPGVTMVCTDENGKSYDYIEDVGAYIGGLYKFLAGAIGILATVMVFYGGIQWIAAAGNASRIKAAKEIIFSALIAIVITLGSYLLLYVINPNLVNLRPPTLSVVQPVFQSFGDSCLTTRICLSGPSAGKKCVADADCQGGGSGICGYTQELGSDSYPKCGKQYNYRSGVEIANGLSTATSCYGAECESSVDICGNINAPLQGGIGPDATCVLPEAICEKITDDIDGVASDCPRYTKPEFGKCAWHAPLIDDDQCFWYAKVQCNPGYTQVGCGTCNTANSTTPIEAFTVDSEGLGVRMSDISQISCTATSETSVYAREESNGKYRSICCQNSSGNLQYITNYLQSVQVGDDYADRR